MAQDNKFGTFGGVFTPSILTILGVIMYLRLPWVVGNAGLQVGLGIIAVAHLVSVCTGLSISSIATDKKVGAGGPYYIISRSLGLPIGGTLGLALFIGLSFSISLYVIGFSESFLAFWDIPVDKTSIRICGSVTMLALTVLTLISTALAIKTQYLILTAIVLSLVSIFLGVHPDGAPAEVAMGAAEGGASLAEVFGIFFPAVTGFTAGVNMSGDLRDPKKSIPGGTIAAVVVGLVVYVALAVFLAMRVPREALMNDGEVLLHLALFPPAVVAGIWGATLSSALGSILGAPRILQAVAGDGIVWRWFAKGAGPSNEPRNALLLAFFIGEGGILYAELDGIARVVSMVFLATYGFLNVTCAIESLVSPDFRPDFRIPTTVSVVGAVVCALLMIQLDPLYMLISLLILGAVFFWLSRKQLTLEAGDAWEGVWSSLVRTGLWRLSREAPQQRMWRPHILAFRGADPAARIRLRGTAAALITGSGLLTDIELEGYGEGGEGDEADEPDETSAASDEDEVGLFAERLPTDDPFRTVADVCRYRGVTGLSPNTVLLDWASFRRDPEPFGELLDQVTQLDHNLLVAASGSGDGAPSERVDLWWSAGAGNANLAVGLTKFFSRHRRFSGVELRFLLVSHDSSSNDHLRSIMRSLLTEARIQGTIRIVNDTLRSGDVLEHVAKESADARLVVVGLPVDSDQCGPAYQERVEGLIGAMTGELLLVRGSSDFTHVLRLSRQATISFIPPSEGGKRASLPELELPDPPELASAVTGIADGYQRLVSRFHKGAVQRVYGREVKLLRRLKKAVQKRFAGLEKGLAGTNPRRLRNLVNRTQSSLLNDLAELLAEFAEQGLEAQRGSLDARVQAFLDGRGVADHDPRRTLTVRRPREVFEPQDGDGPRLASLKARRRFWSRGKTIATKTPIGRLESYYFETAIDEVLTPAVRQYVTDSHDLMVHLGKTLASLRTGAVLLGEEVPEEEELRRRVEEEKQALLTALDELIDHNKRRIGQHQWSTLEASRKVVQRLATDLDRIDARTLARERRVDRRAAEGRREHLNRLPEQWYDHQQLVLERARLGLRLAAFQHRFATTVAREKQAIVLGIRSGALGECERFLVGLRNLREQLAGHEEADDDAPLVIAFDTRADLDERFDLEQTLRSMVDATADLANELPAHVTTLTDESIQRLAEGDTDEVETSEVPVMRLVQFLVEARFVGVVQAALEQIPRLEARASGVAQDAVRLVTFQLSELGAAGEEAATVADQLGPVVDSGIERLEHEIAQLGEALAKVTSTIDEQVGVVLDGTNAYDLTATAGDLDQQLRRHQGEMAAAGARSLLRQTRERLRTAMVRLVYRRSAGLLLARELREQGTAKGELTGRVLAHVQRHQPRPEVMDHLPSYYRRLFYGQATISETFWVGRERQLAQAKRAIATFGRGASGALVVVGERGSGKTSLVQRVTTELLPRRPIYRISAPREGATEANAFAEALRRSVLGEGTAKEMLEMLPDDPVIVLDDLELWWERREGGFAVIEQIYELIEQLGDRVLFVLALSRQAYRFIDRFCPLSDEALAVLECGPVDAEALERIVMLRHGSTGLSFEVDGKEEEQLSELRLARLFSQHFDYAGGHIGAALHAWITHVKKVSGSTLQLEAPAPERWDVLDELRPAHKALLTQLVLHKVLLRSALERITGLERRAIDHDVETLVRMGLVVESRSHGLSVNPFIHHAVVRRLTERGLLS